MATETASPIMPAMANGIDYKDDIIRNLAATIAGLQQQLSEARKQFSVDTSKPNSAYIDEYLKAKKLNLKPTSYKKRQLELTIFLKWAADRHILTFQSHDIAAYLDSRNVNPNSKGLYFSFIADLYRYLHNNGSILKNPMANLKKPAKVASKRKALTPHQIETLFNCAIVPDHKILLTVLYGVGVRISEAIVITPNMIKPNADRNGYVIEIPPEILIGKNGEPIIKELSTEVYAAIMAYVDKAGVKANQSIIKWGGQQCNWHLKKLARIANAYLPENEQIPASICNHVMRHSFVTSLTAAYGDISVTSALVGHKSLNVTANVYNHTSEAVKRSAIAVHPINKLL